MKHIFFTILLFTCLSHLQGQTVSENTARQVAANYLSAQTGRISGSMTSAPGPAIRGGNPAYFVCTPVSGKGFVIVAGTKVAEPVLAYSPDANFRVGNVPPAAQYWLNGYKDQLEEIVARNLRPTQEMSAKWASLEKGTYEAPENAPVGPLLQTTWDQWPRYNKFCPSISGMQAPTGCDATAMAQVMKYWNYPVSGQTSVTDHDNNSANGISGTFTTTVGGQSYQWQNMPNALNSGSSQTQIDQIAKLMYDCGVAISMDYGTAESGADPAAIPVALANDFGFGSSSGSQIFRNNSSDANWVSTLQSNLNAGMPIIYSGFGPEGGHTWVCDGYNGEYFSMNWGWSGESNGFYSLNAADPTPPPQNITFHFDVNQNAIVGIHPPNCQDFFEGALNIPGGIPITLSASDYIHLNGAALNPGVNLTMHAGNYVVLSPGFSALNGSTMHVFIQGCTGSFSEPADDRSQPETTLSEPPATLTFAIFPNPATDYITLQFALPADGTASLRLMDLTGKTVQTLFENREFPAGEQEIQGALGQLPAGVYLARLETISGSSIRKIMKVN